MVTSDSLHDLTLEHSLIVTFLELFLEIVNGMPADCLLTYSLMRKAWSLRAESEG